jgi:hypothetical protein
MPDKDKAFDPGNPYQLRAAKFAEAPRQQVPPVTKVLDLPQVSIVPLITEPGGTHAGVPAEEVKVEPIGEVIDKA